MSSEQRGGTQRPNHRLACTYQIAQWAPPGVVIEAKDIELSPIVRGWTRRGHRVVVGIRELNHPHAIGIHVRDPRRRRVSTCIDTIHGRTTNEAQGTRHKAQGTKLLFFCLSVCLGRSAPDKFGSAPKPKNSTKLSVHTYAGVLALSSACVHCSWSIHTIHWHAWPETWSVEPWCRILSRNHELE